MINVNYSQNRSQTNFFRMISRINQSGLYYRSTCCRLRALSMSPWSNPHFWLTRGSSRLYLCALKYEGYGGEVANPWHLWSIQRSWFEVQSEYPSRALSMGGAMRELARFGWRRKSMSHRDKWIVNNHHAYTIKCCRVCISHRDGVLCVEHSRWNSHISVCEESTLQMIGKCNKHFL